MGSVTLQVTSLPAGKTVHIAAFNSFFPIAVVADDFDITSAGTYTTRYEDGILTLDVEENDYTLGFGVYAASFEPACAKPSDPYRDRIVESAEFRKGLSDALFSSGVEPFAHEVGGIIYQRPDGSYFTKVLPDPGATSCFHAPLPHPAPSDPDGVPVGSFHTHPHMQDDTLLRASNCPKVSMLDYMPGSKVSFTPLNHGGGSPEDWSQTYTDQPMYVITLASKDKRSNTIWKLEPGFKSDTVAQNGSRYKYRLEPDDPGKCAPRLLS
jgi:hypothetical protein